MLSDHFMRTFLQKEATAVSQDCALPPAASPECRLKRYNCVVSPPLSPLHCRLSRSSRARDNRSNLSARREGVEAQQGRAVGRGTNG